MFYIQIHLNIFLWCHYVLFNNTKYKNFILTLSEFSNGVYETQQITVCAGGTYEWWGVGFKSCTVLSVGSASQSTLFFGRWMRLIW